MSTLVGRREIAAYLRTNPERVTIWRRTRAFPAVVVGGGPHKRLITTTDAITAWLVTHGQSQLQHNRKRRNGGDNGNNQS